ncbi:hypothetical protein IFR05_012274 [Cadophora sp. M221]|nr:hypothetical protein IFR05_012274 [Cadophora sp. M221]
MPIPTRQEYDPTEDPSFGVQYLNEMGLQETPPPEEMQEELFQIYFDQVHAFIPMINKKRFFAARRLGLNSQPTLALQLCDVFIQKARKYAERMELDGIGEPQITIYDAQSWCLIAHVEAQRMYITRAWTSTGKCVRLVHLMGLHCVDRPGVYGTRFLPPTDDFIELEERRRTFWAAYVCDRWTSALGGLPMTIQETGICTDLPTSEASLDCEYEEPSISLAEATAEGGASNIPSSFSGAILTTTLLAREYNHIEQSTKFENIRGGNDKEFWERHRELDNSLSNALMYLPERFKVAHELRDPNVVFLGIALQAATICLHRTVINRSISQQVCGSTVSQSMNRCTAAAHVITSTIRLISRQNMSKMSPWTGFCLYVAGLVYCHNLGSSHLPDRDDILDVTFILATMKAIGTFHPITRFFSAQLELEMDAVQERSYRASKQGGSRPKAFPASDEHQYLHDPNFDAQPPETQVHFWRSLSVEERAILSRKVLSSKPLHGIMAYNGLPLGNTSQASGGSVATSFYSSPEYFPGPQMPTSQSAISPDTGYIDRPNRFATSPT